MAEKITLTIPIPAPPAVSDYKVKSVYISRTKVSIELEGTDGSLIRHSYVGDTAETMALALNKANLSIKSLQRRCLERLVADGFLAGTIEGTVD